MVGNGIQPSVLRDAGADLGAVAKLVEQGLFKPGDRRDFEAGAVGRVVLGNPAGVLPYTILIDADGVVRKQQVGPFASAADIADWSGTDAN